MDTNFLTSEGQKYGDFVLVNRKPIEELQSVLREIVHIPSGAQIMHIENEDPENLFCLSFKTLPHSSNGAPHILEHTVLCGSRKFPVKDPFFSMSRRSLNTFMNALTGSDFTCYPAASQVEKDFYNLLEVYLDAVFHPELKEQSFLQEGHHLAFAEPTNPKSPLECKGIVYNEMKGALASVDARIWHALLAKLVPDLPYAYNSGGEPKDILHLTYAELIEFHETYYHPSRCLFFFYGSFPLKNHLDFIEKHALKGAQNLPPLPSIAHQKRFTHPLKEKLSYPILETEALENKHIHAFGWLTTPLLHQEEVLALAVLDSVLMDTDASPLKKALLETKLCIHADSFLDTEMTEVPWVMICRGCKQEEVEQLEKAIFAHLKRISQEGLPFHLIEASIHQLEFSRTEIGGDSSPFGLTLFMRSGLAKQLGCSPEHALVIHSLFTDILEKAKNPHFFSPFIEKYLLHNPHFVRLSFAPDPTLSSKEIEEEATELQKIKESLTEKQIAKILEQTKKLERFQKQIEKQKIECLPKVTLADVPIKTRNFSLASKRKQNIEIFHHDAFTNHILYADLIFDLPALSEEELSDLHIFTTLWTEVGMGKRDFEEVLELVQAHTGGIGAHCSLHVQASDPSSLKPSLQLRGKALARKVDKLFLLFEEMVTKPRFDEKERITDLIQKLATSMESKLSRNAMRYASHLALQGFSTPNHINELWYGLTYYNKIQELAKDLPKTIPRLMDRLQLLQQKILCKGTPHLVMSCDQKLFHQIEKESFFGLSHLPSHPLTPWKHDPLLHKVPDQARIIASPVAFNVEAFKTIHYLHKDSPALQVATLLLENKILHHRIREQGGAYGAGASYNAMWGTFYLYSYRDPHIARSLLTFHHSIEEIQAEEFDDQDLEEAKLGIIQHFDTPTSPGARALVAYTWQRDGKTVSMRQDFRDRLLHLEAKDICHALKTHLLNKPSVSVTFAGKEILDKELPLIENKTLEIIAIS